MNCRKCGYILDENELACSACGRLNYTHLVELAKQGNDEAIYVLYNHSNKKNYYEALKIVHDQGVAEDLVQESIIKSYKRINQLEDPEKFESWFTRILINECKNYIKPMKNNELSFSSVEEDEDYTFENNIEDENIKFSPKENFDYSELKDGLNQVLDELPFEQKMSIILTYLNGFKIKEVAEILEIPENTVKTCQLKGKTAIKKKIEELRKQNKSFYSIAPIPFLVWMLTEEANAMENPAVVMPVVITTGTTGLGASSAQAVGTTIVKTTAKIGFLHTFTGKVTIGCLCILIAGGGFVSGISHFNEKNLVQKEKIQEEKKKKVSNLNDSETKNEGNDKDSKNTTEKESALEENIQTDENSKKDEQNITDSTNNETSITKPVDPGLNDGSSQNNPEVPNVNNQTGKELYASFIQSQANNYNSYFLLDVDGNGTKEMFLYNGAYDIYVYDSMNGWVLRYNTDFVPGSLLAPGPGQGFYMTRQVDGTGDIEVIQYTMQVNKFFPHSLGLAVGAEVSPEAVNVINSYREPYRYGMNDLSGI